jgi:hypothetical protein
MLEMYLTKPELLLHVYYFSMSWIQLLFKEALPKEMLVELAIELLISF